MQSAAYRLAEFFILFVVFPVSLVFEYNIFLKLIFGLLGFVYVILVLLKIERLKWQLSQNLEWNSFWKKTMFKLMAIGTVTALYVCIVDIDNLFVVIRNKPLLWLGILFIYTLFSVYPQELIYRTFYFKRYQLLFKSESLFIFSL